MNKYRFGVDAVSFVDVNKNVYGLDDISNASFNLSFEMAKKNGGKGNTVRDAAVHSQNAELTLDSGICSAELAALISGGLVTTVAAAAASVGTLTTIFGAGTTIDTALGTISISDATKVRTDDYFISATTADTVNIYRVSDAKDLGAVTLTSSGTISLASEGISIAIESVGYDALTPGEKASFSTIQTTTEASKKVSFNLTKPVEIEVRIRVEHNGTVTTLKIPRVLPAGTTETFNATEYAMKSMTFTAIYDDIADQLAEMNIFA